MDRLTLERRQVWIYLTAIIAGLLAFSFGTRNSFVVLPFALSLPHGWEASAVVIVAQSLVELFGMVFCLWWVPRRLFRAAPLQKIEQCGDAVPSHQERYL